MEEVKKRKAEKSEISITTRTCEKQINTILYLHLLASGNRWKQIYLKLVDK
jgi:hypothetical protein